MRISYITESYPPDGGHAAEQARARCDALIARGHDVQLVRLRQRGEHRREDTAEWRVPAIGWHPGARARVPLAWAEQLRVRFELHRPAVVHLATSGPLAGMALRAARSLGVPVTSEFYGQGLGGRGPGQTRPAGWRHMLAEARAAAHRRLHAATDRTLVPTRALCESLRREGLPRVEVCGPGVDTWRFDPSRRDPALRAAWRGHAGRDGAAGTEGRGPVLLFVGALEPGGDVDLALQAFRAARREVPGTCLVVIGGGSLRRALQAEWPQVHFVGEPEGEMRARYYASADVLLYPGLDDGAGQTVLEALASGLPVVAFDGGAASEHLRGRGAGLVVRPGADNGFVGAACVLAAQYPALGALRERARACALRADRHAALARFEAQLLEVARAGRPAVARPAWLV